MSNQPTKPSDRDTTRWSETPWLALKGFLMGAADIVPGVSGGTMALITGIYDRLIHAVRSVDLPLLRSLIKLDLAGFLDRFHWRFLLILLSGIGCAVLFFTRVVPLQVYMHTRPELIFGLFFGLILGSALFLLREIDEQKTFRSVWGPLLGGTVIGFLIVSLVPATTPETPLFLLLTGMIAFCAMILPGISGSYFLVLLGKYDYILGLVGSLGTDTLITTGLALLPFILGGALGLGLFSRLLSWLLKHYHTATLAVLIGFLFGTLIQIWPWQERQYETNITESTWLHKEDPRVQELLADDPNSTLPEYLRLVEPRKQQGDSLQVETVKQTLVQSDPYLPGQGRPVSDSRPLQGVGGVLAGLLMVSGLERLRRKQ
ncbi:MAG: DUF368 domain-containing protein [Bacteroidota bacterium]